MTDGTTDNLEIFERAFAEEQAPLTDVQRQLRRNAAGFALTVFGYGHLDDAARQADLGVSLTQEELDAAKKFREEHEGQLGGHMATVLGETIPYQLSRTRDPQNLGETVEWPIQKDPTGLASIQRTLNRAEDEATQAIMKSEGKKEEAEMLYRLLIKKVEGLPNKPINIQGDTDEETAITRKLTDSFIAAFGGNPSPQARAISSGMEEIYKKTGYRLGNEGLEIPQVKTAEKVRRAAQVYREAVDFFLDNVRSK